MTATSGRPPPSGRARAIASPTGAEGVGTAILLAANRKPAWITRRIDRIEFEDHATVRREVTLDLDIDALRARPGGPPVLGDYLLVPVARLSRTAHTTVDVLDETGSLLPRINKSEERDLMCAALNWQAERLLGHKPSEAIKSLIADILHGRLAPDELRHEVSDSDQYSLSGSQGFVDLLASLHRQFHLIVLLPASCLGRRVIRYTYFEQPGSSQQAPTPAWRAALKTLGAAVAAITRPGRGLPAQFEVANADEATSYHFEFIAPYDVEVYDGALVGNFDSTKAATDRTAYSDDDDSLTRAHVFLARSRRGAVGVFDCVLRPTASGMVRSSAVSSVGISAVLIMTLAYTRTATAAHLASSPDRSSATAALLLAPAVLAALLASPSRHSMTTRLLAGTRINVALACGAMFMAAFAFGFRFSKPHLLLTLWATTWVAGVLTTRLLVQWLVVGFNRRRANAEISQARAKRRG